MTLTEQAEQARKLLMETTLGTEYAEVALKALSLTMAEGWDHGYEIGLSRYAQSLSN